VIVTPASVADYAWIAKRANLRVGADFRAIKASDATGIRGMVGYDGWAPNSVSMHIALDSPAALRSLLRPAFRIPFLEFRFGTVTALVLSTNERSMRLVEHVGFSEAGRLKDGWAKGVDQVIYQMRREDCRWLSDGAMKEAA
jgi:hypothetical protein